MTPDELLLREEVARFRLPIPRRGMRPLVDAVNAAWPEADRTSEHDGWLVIYRPKGRR